MEEGERLKGESEKGTRNLYSKGRRPLRERKGR